MSIAGQHVVVGADGVLLAVRDVKIADGRLTARSAALGDVALPLEKAVRLLRPRPHEKPADVDRVRQSLKIEPNQKDTLVVQAAGADAVSLSVVLSSLDADTVHADYDGTDVSLDAATVTLVEFAAVKRGPPTPPAGYIVCTDGTRLPFAAMEQSGGKVIVISPALGKLMIAGAMVAQVRYATPDAIYLSDLQPSAVRQTPFFDDVMAWRRDRSSAGTPLSLRGTTYEKGLGLHARCHLTFDLKRQYAQLTAVAGIDDSVPGGLAVLRITGDGRDLLKETLLRGGAAPVQLRLDLSGIAELTIVADFAPGTFGVGARVNLCDPLLTPAGAPATRSAVPR